MNRSDVLAMRSRSEAEPVEDERTLPPAYRQASVQLKAEYSAFRPTELATICELRIERQPGSHTS